ncbi:unnamed protein product [Pedinophyceae sp. YPF-701]|nr:unnamed protein product [Pedinophyceae sp. YPF-701]
MKARSFGVAPRPGAPHAPAAWAEVRGRACLRAPARAPFLHGRQAVELHRERTRQRNRRGPAPPQADVSIAARVARAADFLVSTFGQKGIGQDAATLAAYFGCMALLEYLSKVIRRPRRWGSTGSAIENANDYKGLIKVVFTRSSRTVTLFSALKKPVEVLLFLLAGAKSLELLGKQFDIWLNMFRSKGSFLPGLKGEDTTALHMLLKHANFLVEGLHDGLVVFTRLSLIGLIAWFILLWKNQAMELVEEAIQDAPRGGKVETAGTIILSVSQLISWIIVSLALFTTLGVLKVDLRPFLAVGGLSGLLAGFAAQSVLTNILAGFQIFISRPFVVGERLELRTGDGTATVISGVVAAIEPTRTTVRGEDGYPVSIPNKSVTELLVVNHSRQMTEWGPLGPPPRPFELKIAVRLEDADKAEEIISSLRRWLIFRKEIDAEQPVFVGWTGWGGGGKVEISMRCVTTRAGAADFQKLKDRTLRELTDILKKNDAALA